MARVDLERRQIDFAPDGRPRAGAAPRPDAPRAADGKTARSRRLLGAPRRADKPHATVRLLLTRTVLTVPSTAPRLLVTSPLPRHLAQRKAIEMTDARSVAFNLKSRS